MTLSRLVLGVDPSFTHTGIVLCRETKVLTELTVKTKPGNDAERAHRIAMTILDLYLDPQDGTPLVGMENQAFGARHGDTRPAELSGIIKYVLWVHGIPFHLAPPSAVKKLVTGSGRATKEEMVTAVNAAGFATKDHNLADAYAVAQWTLAKVEVES